MKKLLKALFVFMLIFTVWSNIIYLCISFTLFELNPLEWGQHARRFMAFFGYFIGFILAIGLTTMLKIEKQI